MKPIRYRVLLAEQLSTTDKISVTTRVATIYTGEEAKKASAHISKETNETVNPGWQFEILDNLGRVAALKFKGCEVAIFVKRQTTELELMKGDPVPEGVIKDPADVWVRVDVLGASARKVGTRVGKERKSAVEELALAEKQLKLRDEIVGRVETENLKLKSDLEARDNDIQKLKTKVRELQRTRPVKPAGEPVAVG